MFNTFTAVELVQVPLLKLTGESHPGVEILGIFALLSSVMLVWSLCSLV